ncbi:peptidase C15 [Roseibium denhamense]|uniref:Pyrrolidone-carboxylate peptidase n=1 Tax=Roseibium denhamense TaxID=76305 RepID=A0ABY1N658_9HYPH|nr:peptidase C15 [Roseibium denhamense]MTI06077.1 peptidase C15 [Roseibium denhamense]SMP01364.1 pyroglutamyl-peptidase [Roseibium denhamense]
MTGQRAEKTVLVTGFGPFPGAPVNPTQLLMKRLPKRLGVHQHGVAYHFDVLPTTWEARSRVTDTLRREVRPDAIVHFGVDGTRKSINIENRAVNKAIQVRLDSSGQGPGYPELDPSGERSRTATLPARHLVTAARQSGAATNVSQNAGTYLCNATLWDSIGSGIPSIFVHVPPLPRTKQDPRPSLAMVENAAVSLLRELARSLR